MLSSLAHPPVSTIHSPATLLPLSRSLSLSLSFLDLTCYLPNSSTIHPASLSTTLLPTHPPQYNNYTVIIHNIENNNKTTSVPSSKTHTISPPQTIIQFPIRGSSNLFESRPASIVQYSFNRPAIPDSRLHRSSSKLIEAQLSVVVLKRRLERIRIRNWQYYCYRAET